MARRELYVGIDVASQKVDVCFIDNEGRTVRPQARYGNDPQGWTELKAAIVSASSLCGRRPRVVCGMEATGNMHKRLEEALRKEKRRPLEVHVLHPRAVKHFAKALQRSAKTDRIDAEVIAQFLLRLQPQEKAAPPEGLEELREVTRMRRKLIEERTTCKNRLHKLLRYHFPGYKKLLGKQLSNRLLVVLESMPSADLILENGAEKIARIKNGNKHIIGRKFSESLCELASQAPAAALRKSTRMLLQSTAKRIRELTTHVAELDGIIEELLEEVFPNEVLTSIPGLGKVSAAAILAEIGDVRRFTSKGQFIGYCGLYPIVWESGEAKRRYQMTFKGNRMLKMTFLIASAAARQYNPVVATYYERLRKRGKSTKAAGGAIARKLAEIVFALLASNQPWSDDRARAGLSKGYAMSEMT